MLIITECLAMPKAFSSDASVVARHNFHNRENFRGAFLVLD